MSHFGLILGSPYILDFHTVLILRKSIGIKYHIGKRELKDQKFQIIERKVFFFWFEWLLLRCLPVIFHVAVLNI